MKRRPVSFFTYVSVLLLMVLMFMHSPLMARAWRPEKLGKRAWKSPERRASLASSESLASFSEYNNDDCGRRVSESVRVGFFSAGKTARWLTLRRGTTIRSIRLTGDPQEIDCRYEGIKGLVLRAEFVRKR